jgi:hypothetical protein
MNQGTDFVCPDYRGVFANGHLTLVPYCTRMPTRRGPAAKHFADCSGRAVIADFEIVRGSGPPELVVTEITLPGNERFRNAVVEFAERLGYGRVWLALEVIDLDATFPVLEGLWTRCTACLTEWTEHDVEVVLDARRAGLFRPYCRLDGHPVPQPTLLPKADAHFLSASQPESLDEADRIPSHTRPVMTAADLVGFDGPDGAMVRLVGGRVLYDSVREGPSQRAKRVRLERLDSDEYGLKLVVRYVNPDTPMEIIPDTTYR